MVDRNQTLKKRIQMKMVRKTLIKGSQERRLYLVESKLNSDYDYHF